MTDVPATFIDGHGAFGYYIASALKYFYITAHFDGRPNAKWALLRITNGSFELCTSISNNIADIDDRGRLKVIGVDLIE